MYFWKRRNYTITQLFILRNSFIKKTGNPFVQSTGIYRPYPRKCRIAASLLGFFLCLQGNVSTIWLHQILNKRREEYMGREIRYGGTRIAYPRIRSKSKGWHSRSQIATPSDVKCCFLLYLEYINGSGVKFTIHRSHSCK